MVQFIKKIFWAILLFLGINTLIYFSFFNLSGFIRSQDYYYSEFNNAFDLGDFEVIGLGNSKFLSSFHKRTFKKELNMSVANLGCYASNLTSSKMILESYLKYSKKNPDYVILEVSWFSFHPKRTFLHPITGQCLIKNPFLFKDIISEKELFNNYIRTIVDHLYLYRDPVELDYDSRKTDNSSFEKSYVFNKDEFKELFPNDISGVDSSLFESFIEIINLCEDNKINLILFTAPEDKNYSMMQKDRIEIKEIFNKLSKEESFITYLDYTIGSELYDEKFELWLNDSHHINDNERFTMTLSKDIKARMHNNIYTK